MTAASGLPTAPLADGATTTAYRPPPEASGLPRPGHDRAARPAGQGRLRRRYAARSLTRTASPHQTRAPIRGYPPWGHAAMPGKPRTTAKPKTETPLDTGPLLQGWHRRGSVRAMRPGSL